MKTITEGRTKLVVSDRVFFNPWMESNRTVTVNLLNEFFKRPFNGMDALSGTGAKGIRVANETQCKKMVLNDLNPNSRKLMERGVELNSLSNVEIQSRDANVLLSESKFTQGFIDIDPFGSPAGFTDSAIRALLPNDSVLALTATDTGALAGSFKNAALRRYGAKLEKTPCYNELGVRALAGFAVRQAAKYEIGLSVLFAHATRHYYRVFLKTSRGSAAANNALKQTTTFSHDPNTGEIKYGEGRLGPVWAGNIYEINLFNELDTHLPYFDMHRIYQKQGWAPERFDRMEERLRSSGFKTSRTHFNRHAIRCDASFAGLISVLRP